MASKKPTADLSGLVATKGVAEPIKGIATRAQGAAKDEGNALPLNFRVTGEFRRRFKTFAAVNDMKLNELLYRAFEDYERRNS